MTMPMRPEDMGDKPPLYVHPDLPCPRCGDTGIDVDDEGAWWCHCETGRTRSDGLPDMAGRYDLTWEDR